MSARIAVIVAGLAASLPAAAGELTALEAKRLIAGKQFTYTCFEGTSGVGRINADGSVHGSIRIQGKGPLRYARLPANTLRIKGGSVCASLKGLAFEPCFRVVQVNARQFRGSISGLNFAYCDFVRRGGRMDVARARARGSARSLRSASSTTQD